jgi:hypothetical protein
LTSSKVSASDSLSEPSWPSDKSATAVRCRSCRRCDGSPIAIGIAENPRHPASRKLLKPHRPVSPERAVRSAQDFTAGPLPAWVVVTVVMLSYRVPRRRSDLAMLAPARMQSPKTRPRPAAPVCAAAPTSVGLETPRPCFTTGRPATPHSHNRRFSGCHSATVVLRTRLG